MKCWRICKNKYASSPLDGEGARRFGGRWNQKGHAVAYTSSSLPLAVLELLVHLDPADLPGDLVTIEVHIDATVSVETIDLAKLPSGWRTYPAPDAIKDLGTDWVKEQRSAVLIVPSAILPREANYLVNPAHPDAKKIVTGGPEPFTLDPRLLP